MSFTSNNVASIFKILIGTMVVIAMSSLMIELFNTTLTATFVRGIVTKSIEKSCDFFAQETYVRDDDGDSEDAPVYSPVKPIYFSDGSIAVSNSFFGGKNTQKEIYEYLYKHNDFKKFVKQYGAKWLNLRRLGYGLYDIASYQDGSKTVTVSKYDKTAGDQYVKTRVTALNSGITYLDKRALEDIARWNIVANFYGGNPDTLYKGDLREISGGYDEMDDYVLYDGYKIYYNTLKITDIEYDVYDLTNTSEAREFAKRTGVGWDSTTNDVDMDYWKKTVGLTSTDERKNVCVADVKYEMVLSYDGITPIKTIFNFFLNQSARMNDRAADASGASTGIPAAVASYETVKWNDTIDGRSADGSWDPYDGRDFYYQRKSGEALASTEDYSLLDFNGIVTYYIIR